MSWEAQAWVWKQNLKASLKWVLMGIANYADQELRCYPSLAVLSKRLGMTKQAVIANVQKLIEKGLLEKSRDKHYGNNVYQIKGPETVKENLPDQLKNLELKQLKNFDPILLSESLLKETTDKNGTTVPESGNGAIKPMDLVDKWNTTFARVLPQVQYLTDVREQKLKARLKDHPDMAFWNEVFANIRRSRFLTEDWGRCNLDWLIKNETNCIKIVEGNYDNKKGNENRQQRR